MSAKKGILAAALGAAAFFLTAQAGLAQEASPPKDNSCLECHSDMWDEIKSSVHSRAGRFCSDCHGGDPTQKDMALAKAPGTGYIGIPDKKQIIQRCGECHADVETMNFYGTRTDQLARYKTSHHGRKLLTDGDEDVAACTDCHGYHNILKISDPNSSVYPSRVPATCGKCHANEKLMASHNLPANMLKEYTDSVHGEALFKKNDLSVAQCASCHGSHGAVPPGVRDVSATCGKCHQNEKKNFLESPHARLAEQGTFSECVACHGNHHVLKPTPALYDTACAKCHEPGSAPFNAGRELAELVNKAERDLAEGQALVRQASIEGIFVEDEQAMLEQAKTYVVGIAPLQHTLSVEKISGLERQSGELVTQVKERLTQKRKNLKTRRWMLIPIWVFIALMVWALWTKFHELTKAKDQKKDGR